MTNEIELIQDAEPTIEPAPPTTAIDRELDRIIASDTSSTNVILKKSLADRLGWVLVVIAALAPGWMLIQGITIFISHEAKGLSWLAFLLTSIFALIWLFYGYWVVEGRDWVIVASSISTLLASTMVLVGIKMYGDIVPQAQKKHPVWFHPVTYGNQTEPRQYQIIPNGFREFNVYLHR